MHIKKLTLYVCSDVITTRSWTVSRRTVRLNL